METTKPSFFRQNRPIMITGVVLLALPFVIGLIEGSSPAVIWANGGSISRFVEGMGIEIFILALFALSYDLLFGITGLLSFGHAMFFGVAAYLTGISLKTLDLPFLAIIGLVIVVAVLQALLFGVVLPRVKGITFALVTLGMASVFHIIIMSSDLGAYTGADVGLQGVVPPDFLNATNERLRYYAIVLVILLLFYLLYRRFIVSPTGRVCIAIRENEGRAKMLGYNTATFKYTVLIISSLTASTAGMLHALYQPIISPNIADLGYTVTALLIVLIGGVGTLSGALVGAFIFRLLDFGLRRLIGEGASFVIGAVYIFFVLFIPYGIVGTWQLKRFNRRQGWQRLMNLIKPAK